MSSSQSRPDGILILDFGGQYCHLIARRIREMNVYSKILPSDASPGEILEVEEDMIIKGIVLSGSPGSVNISILPFDKKILEMKYPALHIRYVT